MGRNAAGTRVLVAVVAISLTIPGPALSASTTAQAPPPNAVRLGDRILDPAGQARISYEGTVNAASYQQDGLLTYDGKQYAAWYHADGRVVVSRRDLPNDRWASIELDGFLDADDSHNTISMVVSPSDERLHLAIGTHGGPTLYARSLPGLAASDSDLPWSSRSFEPTGSTLPGAIGAPTEWTYPQFEVQEDTTLLTYREGSTSNGRQVLLRYRDDAEGGWEFLDRFTDSVGTYRSPFGTSSSRYAYLHGFAVNPISGELQISWSWREQTDAWCSPSGLATTTSAMRAAPTAG